MKLLIVSSSGGHLYKTVHLKSWWSRYERVWVTKNDPFSLELLKNERIIEGHFPEQRNIVNFLKNLFLAFSVINIEKPDIIFSMGAGIAPPFFIVAKMFRIRTIFIETFISIEQSTLSGRIVYPISDLFLVQNEKLLKQYKKSVYLGSIL